MGQAQDMNEGDTILKLEDVHMHFGKVAALAGVDLEVKKGEIHSIIGPNGPHRSLFSRLFSSI